MTDKARALIFVAALVVLATGGYAYWYFTRQNSLGAVGSVAEAQVIKTSLHEFALLANTVRAAYDQRIVEDAPAGELICEDLFKNVDLSLLAQNLSVDIDEKIQQIVAAQNIAGHLWSGCEEECSCATLTDLLERAVEAGLAVDEELMRAARAAAEELTTPAAIQCAQNTSERVCASSVAAEYAAQAVSSEEDAETSPN